MEKLQSVKTWLWVYSVSNLFFGVNLMLDSAGEAESSWGPGNVLAHDMFYEKLIGVFFVIVGIFGLILISATAGKAQATAAAYLGATQYLLVAAFLVLDHVIHPEFNNEIDIYIGYGFMFIVGTALILTGKRASSKTS